MPLSLVTHAGIRARTSVEFLIGVAGALFLTGCSDGQLNEVVIERGGDTKVVADIWADNWFAMYVDGQPLHEDSVAYETVRSFNAERVTFNVTLPATFAFEFRDFMENDTGLEYIGYWMQQMGDGGAIVQIKRAGDGKLLAASGASWKCIAVHTAPLDKACAAEGNPVAGAGPCRATISKAPDGWTGKDFDDSQWPQATVHPKSAVSPRFGYDLVTWNGAAKFIWAPDLHRDNVVLCRARVGGE